MNVPAGDKKKKGDVDVLILSSLYDFSTDLVCEELSHSDVNSLLSGNFAEGVGYRTDKEGENGF